MIPITKAELLAAEDSDQQVSEAVEILSGPVGDVEWNRVYVRILELRKLQAELRCKIAAMPWENNS